MIREACLRVLVLCTIFLKEAAAAGLCLAEIGEMMSREFRAGEEEPSELEVVCMEARRLITEGEVRSPLSDLEDEEFQFDIDCEEIKYDFIPKTITEDYMARTPSQFGTVTANGCFPLSKLEESIEEEEEEEEEKASIGNDVGKVGLAVLPIPERLTTMSKLSMSLKNSTLCDKKQKSQKLAKAENGYFANTSSGHRSANEQLPPSMTFVKLADMSEQEWTLFLDKFQELLYPAFSKRKSVTLGQRQIQRLGTSCQF